MSHIVTIDARPASPNMAKIGTRPCRFVVEEWNEDEHEWRAVPLEASELKEIAKRVEQIAHDLKSDLFDPNQVAELNIEFGDEDPDLITTQVTWKRPSETTINVYDPAKLLAKLELMRVKIEFINARCDASESKEELSSLASSPSVSPPSSPVPVTDYDALD